MGYKRFTEEFKQKVLAESYARHEVTMVAKKYGIHPSSIHKWKKQQIEREDDEDKKVEYEYTREYKKMVVKTRLLNDYTAESCSQLFKIPKRLVTYWTKELEEEMREEIRKERYIKKRRVFVHATSHSGYWK